MRELCSVKFNCQQDAQEAANNLSRKLKSHNLVDIQTIELLPESVKKASGTANDLGVITYQVKARLERDHRRIEIESRGAGRFVLATNILDVEELSNDEMRFLVQRATIARTRVWLSQRSFILYR